jgi:hypothetical protein
MKLSTKRNTCLTLLVASAALTVSACGMDIRPAPQGPRYYTAAHDTVSGKCQRERIVPSRTNNKVTVEDALPQSKSQVRCVTTAVTTTGESN